MFGQPVSRCVFLSCLICLVALPARTGEVARKGLRLGEEGKSLLRDDAWRAHGGHKVVREGDALVCDNAGDARAVNGLVQTVVLDQKQPLPIVAVAWSRADRVTGTRDSDYSLYLDLRYQDGTPLWGQSATFDVGSHDWQKAVVKIFPARAVKDVTVNLLLRRHAGKAGFRGMHLRQVEMDGGVTLFDGVAVESPKATGEADAGAFSVRDVAAESDFVRFDNLARPSSERPTEGLPWALGHALGLKLQVTERGIPGGRHYTARLEDTTGKDRSVTLVFARKLSAGQWQWQIDPRRSEPAVAPREYQQAHRTRAGQGRLGWYPLAAVVDAASSPRSQGESKHQGAPDAAGTPRLQGHAVCLDMTKPAVFRTGFNAALNELFIAFDLGLTRERPHAEVAFASLDFDGLWGFRGAMAAVYRAFGDHFRRRVDRQGVWMPFAKISKVDGWQDFGFAFKEGNDETAWDDANGITTFRYTEPMTWWMPMPKDMPRTYEAALACAKALADKGNRSAQALLTSGMHDEQGGFVCRLLDTPWCNGAVWSINSSPAVAGDMTDFKNKWNPRLREQLYGSARKGDLDGEYVDSSEGYVTSELDFRRDHFATAARPLTFDSVSLRPAVFRGLVAWEYVAGLAADVHGMGKLMMANGAPTRLCWLVPHLDVLGTETNWNPGGRWRPMGDGDLLYRRVLCGPKPYCFLMNTEFEKFPFELSERFMKRCLAYGMFPGYFSHNASQGHYFTRRELYDRDRPLFKKYIPLCKRVAEAGWQPITLARSSDAKVYVERWGGEPGGKGGYLTIFNDSPDKRSVVIRIEGGLAAAGDKDLVAGRALQWCGRELTVELDGEDVALVEVK